MRSADERANNNTYQEETQCYAAVQQRRIVASSFKHNTYRDAGNDDRKLITAQCQKVQCFQWGRYIRHIQHNWIDDQLEYAIGECTRRDNAQLLRWETILGAWNVCDISLDPTQAINLTIQDVPRTKPAKTT